MRDPIPCVFGCEVATRIVAVDKGCLKAREARANRKRP